MADWKKYSDSGTEPVNPGRRDNYKTATIVVSVLFVIAAMAAIYFGVKSTGYHSDSIALSEELSTLNLEKTGLETNLTTLNTEYDTKIRENNEMQATIEERIAEINTLQTQVKKVRSQLKNSEESSVQLQNRLVELEEIKNALQADVDNLKSENVQLVAAKDELNATLANRESEIEGLSGKLVALSSDNEKMQNRLFLLAPAGYRAGNFSIDIEKRNDKLTAKARQAREVKVKFDLPNIPQDKQGESEIYLVVTDIHGNAVTQIPSSSINVKGANEMLKVQAADIQKVNLKDKQSLVMSFKPDDKLSAGEYNLMVYSDDGYLGATAFRLR